MVGQHEGISIFCGIGERCREGEELYREMRDAGVMRNTVMVFGQMNEPPGRPVPRRPHGAHHGRILPRRRAAGRAAPHRQYLPLHPGGPGGLGPHGASALPARLPAHPGLGPGRAGRADLQHHHGGHHLHPGRLCPGRRFHRPLGVSYLQPSDGHPSSCPGSGPARDSTRPSISSSRAPRCSCPTSPASGTTASPRRSEGT